jgi:hypothetical protein
MQSDAESTTEKWGLEAGLFKVWSDKNADGKTKGQQVGRSEGLFGAGAAC